MKFNIPAAVSYLDPNAQTGPTGQCATYVRQALAKGGIVINPHPRDAKDYGPYLLLQGFVVVSMKKYSPSAGDIVVIQNYPAGVDQSGKPYDASNPAGHIAMYDGAQWVSDFVQRDMWGGPGMRAVQPNFVIYRP